MDLHESTTHRHTHTNLYYMNMNLRTDNHEQIYYTILYAQGPGTQDHACGLGHVEIYIELNKLNH